MVVELKCLEWFNFLWSVCRGRIKKESLRVEHWKERNQIGLEEESLKKTRRISHGGMKKSQGKRRL